MPNSLRALAGVAVSKTHSASASLSVITTISLTSLANLSHNPLTDGTSVGV